jgi:hypothetical protein
LKTEMVSLASNFVFQTAFPLLVLLMPHGLIVFHLVRDYRIEDAGELVRRGRDAGFGSQFGLHAPQVLAHLGLAVVQGIGRLTEKLSRPVFCLPYAGA